MRAVPTGTPLAWYPAGLYSEKLHAGSHSKMLVFLSSYTQKRAPRAALPLLCAVVSLCGLGGPAEAKSGGAQATASSSALAGAEFAIGDFDGDRIPDLATVEAKPNGTQGDSRYAIRLQLTSGAAQVFGLTAPAGGLQIVAQDINGDNALDVLVRTAWQHQAIAVLLNDGHGNFTLADPGAFAASAQDHETQCGAGSFAFSEGGVLVRLESSRGDVEAQIAGGNSQAREMLPSRRGNIHAIALLICSVRDRAPPESSVQI